MFVCEFIVYCFFEYYCQDIILLRSGMYVLSSQAILQQDELKLKQLLQKTKQLGLNTRPNYSFSGSGCRQSAELLTLPVFRLSVITGLLTLTQTKVYSIMVTASHNPASDNGIKLGYTNANVFQQELNNKIKRLLNDDEYFKMFVEQKVKEINKNEQNELNICFVGRDTRISSPSISQQVCNSLKMLGVAPIDLGICSTPELFSLSQQILSQHSKKQIKQLNIQQAKQKYVRDVLHSFKACYQKLNQNNKPKILLDFSNGCGAVSYLLYKDELQKYFDVTQICNKDFSNTNFKCGAQYYYKNWNLILKNQEFQKYDECFFFDGDSDRIVVHALGFKKPFDGNCFSIFFIKMLKQIFAVLMQDEQLKSYFNEEDTKLNLIGTTFSNLGVKLQAKKLGTNFYSTDIGTANIFRKAVQLQQTSVFFEPNGHGGIYMPIKIVQKVEKALIKFPDNLQLKLLESIYKILKNNSRGYGLHNMLVYYLCKNYLKLQSSEFNDLYLVVFQIQKDLTTRIPNNQLFKNGENANKQLREPKNIVQKIQQISLKYSQYEVMIRKSATSKDILRVSVQGLEEHVCSKIIDDITQIIRSGGHLEEHKEH